MGIFSKNKGSKEKNKLRLQNIVDLTIKSAIPSGWKMKTFAIGGLTEVGFSKKNPRLLLIISSQGRGVIDCSKLELTARDHDTTYDWINSYELWSFGIGELSDEKVLVGGLHGGGLPHTCIFGDSLIYMATDWPTIDIIFEPNLKSVFKEEDAQDCYRVFHNSGLRAFGFSYNGQYFIIATSSEVMVYSKEIS
ncbi:MAG TPA: hypothetical protein PK904_00385 [Bacteroidales bacterium]|nr:hypothetical protein [Bacteroidales bacterium]